MKIPSPYLIPILSIFFCLSIGLIYYGVNKWFIVTKIQLELQKEPAWEESMNDIQSILQSKLQKFIGKKIWQVSFSDLKKILHSESRVGSVKILRLLPNRFFIQIQPRKPLVVLLDHYNGNIHPLSLDGQVLPPVPSNQVPNLPILRGSVFLKQKAIRHLAIQFINLMPKKGEFSQQEISEVKYLAHEKSMAFILSKNGKPIKVGYDPTQIKTKRIESVLRYLNQKNIKWRVIDARFSQKIVVSTSKAI